MKTESSKKGRPRSAGKTAKGKPRRAATKAKHPPVTVEPRDDSRKAEALTISEAREAAAALAERLKHRFKALLDPPKKGGKR